MVPFVVTREGRDRPCRLRAVQALSGRYYSAGNRFRGDALWIEVATRTAEPFALVPRDHNGVPTSAGTTLKCGAMALPPTARPHAFPVTINSVGGFGTVGWVSLRGLPHEPKNRTERPSTS